MNYGQTLRAWKAFAEVHEDILNAVNSTANDWFAVKVHPDTAYVGMKITAPNAMTWLECVDEWTDEEASDGLRIALWPDVADQQYFDARYCRNDAAGRPKGLEDNVNVFFGGTFYTEAWPEISAMENTSGDERVAIAARVRDALNTTGRSMQEAFAAIDQDYIEAFHRDYMRSTQYMDSLYCWCGNTPSSGGFYPSTAQGAGRCDSGSVPSDDWDGIHSKCARCGVVVRCTEKDLVKVSDDDDNDYRYLLPIVAKVGAAGYSRSY